MCAFPDEGSKHVRVVDVPEAVLQHAQDIRLQITAMAICGSDPYLNRGKVQGMKDGEIFSREFIGAV